MKRLYSAVVAIAVLTEGAAFVYGQTGLSITPVSYSQVSQTFITRSESYFTYQAYLANSGPAVASVTAAATSLSPDVTVVPGQGTLHFSQVPANSATLSLDTFTLHVTNGVRFDGSQIAWTFNGPVSNAGPGQTVPVLSTVTLNGSASTNSGTGSLVYSWAIQSAPAGSTAKLSNANSVIATFQPDLLGTYLIALAVSNGSQSSTSVVTISTTPTPPTANAGPNQTAAVGSTVTLNGTGSTDSNNQPLTYSWRFVSTPPTSNTFFFAGRSATPNFLVDQPGTYIVGLIVNDGTLSSSLSTATISTGNTPPVAVATATPQTVTVNTLVQLDGSKSTDVDGNPLTFSWTLNTTQAPQSKATLSNPNIVNPTFTPDVAGAYIAQLIVRDGTVPSQAATVTVTATATSGPPTANAGSAQTVAAGTTVTLHGSGADPRNLPLTYAWSLTQIPPGSAASLSGANTQNPTFLADLAGTYSAQLVVNDGSLLSNPASVTITAGVSNRPVAVPTTSTPSVPVGSTVFLSGISSFDPANNPITGYMWSLTAPPGSTAALSARGNSASASFVADVAGTYVAQLIVSDAFASSTPATVSISAGSSGLTMTPNPLNLLNTPLPLQITLGTATGASPVNVSLSGFDSTIIALSSNTVTIPPNSASANVLVTPLTQGTTSITAIAPGYGSGTGSIVVATPTISLSFNNNATSVALNNSIVGTVILSAPASPPFGTSVTLADVEDRDSGQTPGLVTFSPTSVVIPAGSTTGTFTMTGARVGPVELLPGAPNYQRVHFINFAVTAQ